MVTIEPNSFAPNHIHSDKQAGILVEDELEMGIHGEVRILTPRDMYIILGNVEHYA